MSSLSPVRARPVWGQFEVMTRLKIFLFGGFEVWDGDHAVGGFESQKVRALLAYLVMHRTRALSRERLAGFLWAEKDEESARRNLRQAVYNLKASLPEDDENPLVEVDSQSLRLTDETACWIDVEEFESDLAATADGPADHHRLTRAVQLYRGDFLAGFFVKDCPEFEEWQLVEQERLREQMLEALRTLTESCAARGEYRLGIQYARRLVAMEPLAEEAHRRLLVLYGLSGRRDRAIAHFAGLKELLNRELGVEPLAETVDTYESILAEELAAERREPDSGPLGPIIPLVGRQSEFERLRETWRGILAGDSRLTLVTGASGSGKTRLVKSFLDSATMQRRARVLLGRSFGQTPQLAFQAIREVLRQLVTGELDDEGADRVPPPGRLQLPTALVDLAPGGRSSSRKPSLAARSEALAGLLAQTARGGDRSGGGDPVIVFFDDLQWADPATLAVLGGLADQLPAAPVWLIGAYSPEAVAAESPLAALAARAETAESVERLEMRGLGDADLEEIARAMVAESQVLELTEILADATAGLPLAVSTVLNALWDEGSLVPADNRWRLEAAADRLRALADAELEEIILERFRRLPTSTRRLASLAAVVGQRFDADLLERAEHEHAAVIEVGLEILLERWMIRQFPHFWSAAGLESDIVQWSKGARRGSFEFDHHRIRTAIYSDLNPLRRQAIHRQILAALETLEAGDRAGRVETLAYHAIEAAEWESAAGYLEEVAAGAGSAGAEEVEKRAHRLSVQVLEKLVRQTNESARKKRWAKALEKARATAS